MIVTQQKVSRHNQKKLPNMSVQNRVSLQVSAVNKLFIVFLRIVYNSCTFELPAGETIEERVETGKVTNPSFLMVQVPSAPQPKLPVPGIVYKSKFN
jgi:hypothetical protein